MVATDGHRLGSSFYTGEYETSENVSSILAPKTLMNLVRILDEVQEDSMIQVSLGDKYILFSNQTITLCSKLIDGPYPDYEKVIPKSNNKRAVINKALLLEAVRRVSVLSNQKTHLVKFSFRKKELEIVVLNRDIGGEARQLLPIVYEGDEHVIGFNAAYLIEILSIIKTESVRLEMNTQISPCLLFPFYEKEEDKKCDDLFLIMPLRILDEIE
jgi:DNA polymerase-3 subunit beta